MAGTEAWQVSTAAAEVYEASFVPAIFGAWAVRVADAAEIASGDAVLDVACGTGVLARRLLRACEQELTQYVQQPSGEIVMPLAAHILTAAKPA